MSPNRISFRVLPAVMGDRLVCAQYIKGELSPDRPAYMQTFAPQTYDDLRDVEKPCTTKGTLFRPNEFQWKASNTTHSPLVFSYELRALLIGFEQVKRAMNYRNQRPLPAPM